MLSPGEFVVNSKDTQKNLPLLEHINKGGKKEDVPDKIQKAAVQQTEETSSLISPCLGLNIAKHNSSLTDNKTLDSSHNQNNNLVPKKSSPHNYSSPPLIFNKANSNTSSQTNFDTPSEWSTIEDLMNVGNNNSDTNINTGNHHASNNETIYPSTKSPQKTFTKKHHVPKVKGFAKGGEVKESDISQDSKIITETINAPSNSNDNDEIALESLAREIYRRLRQELEIEKERQGSYSGRLPW